MTAMKEPIRYLENAKKILSESPIEFGRYADDKYVKSACGTAYLGVLKAIDEYLLREKGFLKKELPKSVDIYRVVLKKHLGQHNGKLLKQFEDIYDELHIGGYYRGLIHRVGTVQEILKTAEDFIKKVAPQD